MLRIFARSRVSALSVPSFGHHQLRNGLSRSLRQKENQFQPSSGRVTFLKNPSLLRFSRSRFFSNENEKGNLQETEEDSLEEGEGEGEVYQEDFFEEGEGFAEGEGEDGGPWRFNEMTEEEWETLSDELKRKIKWHNDYEEDMEERRRLVGELDPEEEPLHFTDRTRTEIYELFTKNPERWTLDRLAASFDINKGKIAAIVRLKHLEALEEERSGPLDNSLTEMMEDLFPEVYVDGIPGDSLEELDPFRHRRPRSVAIEESEEVANLSPRGPKRGLGPAPPGEEVSTELMPGWRTESEVEELRKRHGITHPLGGKVILMAWGSSARSQPIIIRELSGSVRTASWAERERLLCPPSFSETSLEDQVRMTMTGEEEIVHHFFEGLDTKIVPVTASSPYSFENLPRGNLRKLLGQRPKHKKPHGRKSIQTKGKKVSYHKRRNKTTL